MRVQVNRLPAEIGESFTDALIDRNRPLRFRLNGRVIAGFVGDSVLSATMASGIDTLGRYAGQPLGLTPSAHPAISLARHEKDARHALSMARMPAMDGADFVTLGGQVVYPLARMLRSRRSLGMVFDNSSALDRPWRGLAGASKDGGDLVIVGGGVAGMEAALAASGSGLSVTLVESGPVLGGHSGLFGTQDGEAAPEADMAQLRAAIAAQDAITVFTHSHAFALRPGLVRVHRVGIADGQPAASVIDLAARFIIIATGAQERLPIFSGNRLPGAIGTRDAYELASRYHVWPGRTALFATSSNIAYRLAMLASDAGIKIERILDSRSGPSSRFIAFSRAYGLIQTQGAIPERVSMTSSGLAMRTNETIDQALETERLLVCGGWQPDLTLWHIAGGRSRWSSERHRLEPEGVVEGIALAGSTAGYLTRRGCIGSGRDAVNLLLGRPRKPVPDSLIDPLHETPDAPPGIGTAHQNAASAFLDAGPEFQARPAPAGRSWSTIFRGPTKGELPALSEASQPLTIGAVAAGVELGLIPADAAGIVAQERVALVGLAHAEPERPPLEDNMPGPEEVPSYLEGRFGIDAKLVSLVPEEPRQFSSGALIYRNSDPASPLDAIGIVLRPAGATALALTRGNIAHGLIVSVRDQGRPIAARVDTGVTPN
ncbi:FAD-dependent oxidoreductase [Devosia faecipullorum]|uniref:FAD-dependent oxidoreductase n=1 Tax=Devosia faecipullorum TaxID=2755039 RepID=UPI00187B645F|nr:FAD-dependent oxidoreductase [Devosia faecipullorum]MBE7733644.1 FAD-dependent oxidoreductase [Devosia faecipullorum]